MTDTAAPDKTAAKTDWVAVIRERGPDFASRSAAHDADDSFVAENYAALKDRGFFAAALRAMSRAASAIPRYTA